MWGAIIGGLVSALISGLKKYGGAIAAKILIFFGLSMVTYTFGVQPLLAMVKNQITSLPSIAIDVISVVHGDSAISMIFSALAVRGASRFTFRKV